MTHIAKLTISTDYELSRLHISNFLNNQSGLSANLIFSRGNNTVDYIVIFKDEESKHSPMFTVGQLKKMTKDELEYLRSMLFVHHYFDATKDDLIDELKNVSRKSYYQCVYENTDHWHELQSNFTLYDFYRGDSVKVLLDDGAHPWEKQELQNLFFEPLIGIRLEVLDASGEPITDEYALEQAYFDLGGGEYELDAHILKQAIDKLYKDEPFYQDVLDAYKNCISDLL